MPKTSKRLWLCDWGAMTFHGVLFIQFFPVSLVKLIVKHLVWNQWASLKQNLWFQMFYLIHCACWTNDLRRTVPLIPHSFAEKWGSHKLIWLQVGFVHRSACACMYLSKSLSFLFYHGSIAWTFIEVPSFACSWLLLRQRRNFEPITQRKLNIIKPWFYLLSFVCLDC